MTRRRVVRARQRNRAGFTIIEVVVAIMILTVGVLGLAGSAAIVTRMMASAEVQSDAAVVAAARFETLRGTRCPVTSGSLSRAGISEQWTVVQLGNTNQRVYAVVDTVRFSRGGVQQSQGYRSVVKCLP